MIDNPLHTYNQSDPRLSHVNSIDKSTIIKSYKKTQQKHANIHTNNIAMIKGKYGTESIQCIFGSLRWSLIFSFKLYVFSRILPVVKIKLNWQSKWEFERFLSSPVFAEFQKTLETCLLTERPKIYKNQSLLDNLPEGDDKKVLINNLSLLW